MDTTLSVNLPHLNFELPVGIVSVSEVDYKQVKAPPILAQKQSLGNIYMRSFGE
jgi:hypothetical protein